MNAFMHSAAFADLILAVLSLELIAVFLLKRHRLLSALQAALPGALLVLALRAISTGADWHIGATFAALSLPAHLIDLRARGII
jgi:hypothetical protein